MSGVMAGKYVVNTRARSRASDLDALLRQRGAIPVSYPCIDISPPPDTKLLDARLAELARDEYDWLVLTSANAVRSIAEGMNRRNLRFTTPTRFETAVVGPATRDAALRALELTATVMPENYQALDLAAEIPHICYQHVLLPQSEIAPPDLADALAARGAIVTAVTAYRTIVGSGGVRLTDYLVRGDVDALTFTSSSAVDGFLTRIGQEGSQLDLLTRIPVICIGKSTASRARACGFPSPIVPVEQTLTGLIDALDAALTERSISKGMVS